MDCIGSHQKSKKLFFTGAFVLICLATVIFHWVMAPKYLYHTVTGLMLSYLALWSIIFLWSEASSTEQVKRFFLTTGSISLTIGFLELFVAIQAVDFRKIFETPVSEPWHHPANVLDSKLLHIHQAHDRWVWYDIEYRYDQYGLRNDTDMHSAELVVIGDSFVEGLGVSSADSLTTHLAKRLNRSVANVAQSWYGPNQELELLKRYGLKLNPQICVWVFYEGNDLGDVHRYKMATQDWEKFSKNFHSFRQRSFIKNAVLAFGRLFHPRHNQNSAHSKIMKEQSGVFKSPSGEMIRLDFHDQGYYLSEDDRIALNELGVILEQAANLCHRVGAKFLFVFAPTKFRVYKEFTEFNIKSQPYYWVINELPLLMKTMIQDRVHDGRFLDLTPSLVEHAQNGPLLYFNHDTHWSSDGHRIAASAIAKALEQWD